MARTRRTIPPNSDFLRSITSSFQILQLICLSSFCLRDIPSVIPPKRYRFLVLFMIVLQLFLIFFTVHQYVELPAATMTPSVKLAYFVKFILIQFNTIALFIESYINRHKQQELLLQINSMDFILEFKVGIKICHTSQRSHHQSRLNQFVGVHFVVFMISTVTIHLYFGNGIARFLTEFFSVVIVAMRYYQLAMLANVLYHRYRLINAFLDASNDRIQWQQISPRSNFSRILERINDDQRKPHKTNIGCNRLNALRRVCCGLSAASQTINEQFKWTLPFCIFSDFIHYLFGVFYILNILLGTEGDSILLIVPVARFFMVVYHVVFFVIDCGDCSEEVCGKRDFFSPFYCVEKEFV